MGKKSRKKKNVDFKKVKLKVGRKLPKGKDVDLSFATKKISIREDKPWIDGASGQKILHLPTIASRLRSRHTDELVSALTDLKLWMKQEPEDARQLLLMEMQTGVIPLMRHMESKVRGVARLIFLSLLHVVGSTPAYFPSLAQGMFSALVHIDVGVRASGWDYLRLILDTAPNILASINCGRLLDELSRRIPPESVGVSSKKVTNMIKIVERLLMTLSPSDKQLKTEDREVNPMKVKGILSPSQCFLFDFDPAGADRLWLNSHLTRAAEGGLGWADEENYTVAAFISDLSNWYAGQIAEFQNIEKSTENLYDRLLSLLIILKTALRHHILIDALTEAAFKIYSENVEILWRLFPIADDATILFPPGKAKKQEEATFLKARTINMTILNIRCMLLLAKEGEVEEDEENKVGEYFNKTMPYQWPPPKSVCYQWTSFAEMCLRPSIIHHRPEWVKVLISIVGKIGECNAVKDANIPSLCRNILSSYCQIVKSLQ